MDSEILDEEFDAPEPVLYFYGKSKDDGKHIFSLNPEDIEQPLEISETEYRALQKESAGGKHLEWDENGFPVAVAYGAQTWYEPLEGGKVGAFAGYRFSETCIKATENIIRGYDGNYYLASRLPEKPLDLAKQEKRAEINAARNAAEQSGFEYMGKTFDSDQISCQRISCAAQAMQLIAVAEGEPKPTITWTCQDNTTIDLTAAELQGLVAALAQWSNSCHQKATALKTALAAAKTAAEIAEISWNKE
jgi:hypothetical protein